VLKTFFREERQKLVGMRKELTKALPALEAFYATKREDPVIKIHDGHTGTRLVLEDVLKTMAAETNKEYRVYSAANIREYIYYNFSSFSERRIKARSGEVIAMGAGGDMRGLDERRWITTKRGAPAYIIIYAKRWPSSRSARAGRIAWLSRMRGSPRRRILYLTRCGQTRPGMKLFFQTFRTKVVSI